MRLDGFTEFVEVIIHAAHRPRRTIIIGLSFKARGRINMDVLIGGIHDIALPATMDREDKAIIGLIILIGSSMLIKCGPEFDDHITDILNRTE